MSFNVILKGSRPKKFFKAMIGIDVSGSISSDDVREFLSEIQWLFKKHQAEVEVVTFDDGITHKKVVKNIDDLGEFKQIYGRGGTSYTQLFDYALEEQAKELIIFTDGYGNANDLNPPPHNMHVWWVCTTKNMDFPFGAVFYIDQ